MPEANRCLKCGSERPAGAVEGLCPRCMLGQALELGPSPSEQTDLIDQPHPTNAPLDPREIPTGHHPKAISSDSVLNTLADSLGEVPRLRLRDSEPAGTEPMAGLASKIIPGDSPARERYQILGEIAHGGMGAVFKGRDTDLGRDLAVKVLLEKHRDDLGLIRRFIEEAQIGGQLQHPGIVPVYELGRFEDRRPFFAMKLVRGHTLAALLDARKDPVTDRPRFLAIFEAICQTMAYAHARGVIHRDLKPHNVMVGSFGEVQVMDWGLAKVLHAAAAPDDGTPERAREAMVETARSTSETYASRAGSVMGTLGYMAPEQAAGDLDAVDERADVFAMGAILCEILTGAPPYTGPSSGEVHRKAVDGDLAEAYHRLANSGAEAELLALARRCLAARAENRPRDAGEVAQAMTAYLAGVQERLRSTELARVEAQARAEEERKRRKTQFRMAAAVLLALAAGTAGVAFQWKRAETQKERAEANLGKAEARFALARQAIERLHTGASEDVLLKSREFKELRAKLLGSSLEFYKKLQASLEAETGDAPRPELAAAYESVGKITGEIGSPAGAIEAYQRALEIRQTLAERAPDQVETQSAPATVFINLAGYLADLGRTDEAIAALKQSLAIYRRLADEHPDADIHRIELARVHARLGMLLGYQLGRTQDGMEAADRAVAVYAGLTRESQGRLEVLQGLGEAHSTRATLLHQTGHTAEALEAGEKVVAAYEQWSRLRPEDLGARSRLGRALINTGTAATNLDRTDEAGRCYQLALKTYQELLRDRPNDLDNIRGLGLAHQSLAHWLYSVRRHGKVWGSIARPSTCSTG